MGMVRDRVARCKFIDRPQRMFDAAAGRFSAITNIVAAPVHHLGCATIKAMPLDPELWNKLAKYLDYILAKAALAKPDVCYHAGLRPS
jgi:hypothetical protein